MPANSSTHPISRIAWAVLVMSFAMLCGLCSITTFGIYTFLFTSTVPMEMRLAVGRGTALVINQDFAERGVRVTEDITARPVAVSMDSQSQANVSVLLPAEDGGEPRLLSSITLKSSTDVRFQQAVRPRFSWTNAGYHMTMRSFFGRMDVVVTGEYGRSFLMEITTVDGRLVQINGAGRYTLEATNDRVRVITYEGEAVLYSNNRSQNRIIPRGTEGVIYAERSDPTVSVTRQNIVENGLFAFTNAPEVGVPLPGRWGCTNVQDDSPRGTYMMDNWLGRPALRLVRGQGASSHGETRCLQPISPDFQDVRGYNFLELDASFLISYQSLSDCGTRGSECPMMLRMVYEDENGIEREWFQGFYTTTNPTVSWPPRCESCTQDHLQINEKVWYTFETGNLFNIIAPALRPAKIKLIEFYASGHQYDLFVSEISLFVGYVDAVPAVAQGG